MADADRDMTPAWAGVRERVKRFIEENVYPVEIESVLYKHPDVHMCAVIGVSHAQWGQVGKACVVLKPQAVTSPEEMKMHLRDNLASYKVPASIEFMDSLPLSGMGKILKSQLRERFSK